MKISTRAPEAAAAISAWALASASRLRPVITTVAPSWASARALARPMLALAPVTRAVFPFSTSPFIDPSSQSLWRGGGRRHAAHAQDLDRALDHLALQDAFAGGGRQRRIVDIAHDIHARDDIAEGGEARGGVGIARSG